MWEARAEYADGTTVERLFADNGQSDSDQQYAIECWLLDCHPGCTWYSVNYVED